jgi:membrane fusion protein (multidrug efflux system)
MKRNIPRALAPVLLLIFAIIAVTTHNFKPEKAKAADVSPLKEVSYVTLQTEAVRLTQELSGRVKASLSADVRPQVDGIIKEMLFQEGEQVTAGQTLYRLDAESYMALCNQAQAALKSAEAHLVTAAARHGRYSGLSQVKAVSVQEADDAKAAYLQAQAVVLERQAALETARINLARTDIKAPISGYINISNYTIGALVTANQTAVMATIRSVDIVYVDMTRSVTQVQELRRLLESNAIIKGNMEVILKFDDDSLYKYKGELKLQEISVNEATGTVTLRAAFPNPDRELMPGMFVRAIAETGVDNNAILADQRGVTWDAKGNSIALVVAADNIVEQRIITVSQAIGDKWLVVQGLAAGDRLIVEGGGRVRNGNRVMPVNASAGLSGGLAEGI